MKVERRKELFESIGVVAIVASLVFLALEIRQTNQATRISSRDLATQGNIEQLREINDPAILAVANQKAWANEQLSDLEMSQLNGYHIRRWWNFDRTYFLYREGVISEQEWTGFEVAIEGWLTGTGTQREVSQDAWRVARQFLSREFVAYVDENILLLK